MTLVPLRGHEDGSSSTSVNLSQSELQKYASTAGFWQVVGLPGNDDRRPFFREITQWRATTAPEKKGKNLKDKKPKWEYSTGIFSSAGSGKEAVDFFDWKSPELGFRKYLVGNEKGINVQYYYQSLLPVLL